MPAVYVPDHQITGKKIPRKGGKYRFQTFNIFIVFNLRIMSARRRAGSQQLEAIELIDLMESETNEEPDSVRQGY